MPRFSLEPAHPDDRYGDVLFDPERSRAVYREWLVLTRPLLGPGDRRRPEFVLGDVKSEPAAGLVGGPGDGR